jgi:hypothetical protein
MLEKKRLHDIGQAPQHNPLLGIAANKFLVELLMALKDTNSLPF